MIKIIHVKGVKKKVVYHHQEIALGGGGWCLFFLFIFYFKKIIALFDAQWVSIGGGGVESTGFGRNGFSMHREGWYHHWYKLLVVGIFHRIPKNIKILSWSYNKVYFLKVIGKTLKVGARP